MKKILSLFAALAALSALANANVTQKISLSTGWNAVYIEPTPTENACDKIFASIAAITKVEAYVSDAYTATAQYDSDGNAINQKPVSYLVWHRDSPKDSTLSNITGGNAYLIYATAACTLTLSGKPALPRMSWREVSASSDPINLVGPSLEEGASVTAENYYREGPAGAGAKYYTISTSGDEPKAQDVLTSLTLVPGVAYGASATCSRVWPGVVSVLDAPDGILIAAKGSPQTAIRVQNAGTTNHTFSISYGAGDDGATPPTLLYCEGTTWTNLVTRGTVTFELEASAVATLYFAADRTSANATGAGVLTIKDLGATQMRVRLPVVIEASATAEDAAQQWPNGFFMGSFTLDAVNYRTNATPERAGGTVQGTLLYACRGAASGSAGTRTLLQRVCYGATNGVPFYSLDLTKARTIAASSDVSVRRVSSVLLDVRNPVVTGLTNEKTHDVTFTWVVDQKNTTNPMRHSWHPDHDGVRHLSDGSTIDAPSGDNLVNYQYSVKPEVFSITNVVTLKNMPYYGESAVDRQIDQAASGEIVWELHGLMSPLNGNGGKIVCSGTYAIERVGDFKKLEE